MAKFTHRVFHISPVVIPFILDCIAVPTNTAPYAHIPSVLWYSVAVSVQVSVSQPPGRGPVPDPGINCTGPREVLLEFVILVF